MKENIAVIIPVHNEEKYIKETIESVRNQSLQITTQIIVIDDGSTDKTCELIKQEDCILLRQKHKGTAVARNQGIKYLNKSAVSENQLVLFLDGDDILDQHAIKFLYEQMKDDQSIQIVYSKARDFTMIEGLPRRKEPYSGCMPGCALFKYEVFDQVGLFNENLKTGETVDWMLRAKDKGIIASYIDRVTLNRRIHPESTGMVHKNQERADYISILRQRMKKNNVQKS